MPTATAVSFFIPRTPVVKSTDKRWTPYRHQQWGMWVSALRLWGQGIGPIKTPIDYPIRVKATVRWPRCGVAVEQWHPGQWRLGIEGGMLRSGLVMPGFLRSVEVAWELVGVAECGTMIEFKSTEEHDEPVPI